MFNNENNSHQYVFGDELEETEVIMKLVSSCKGLNFQLNVLYLLGTELFDHIVKFRMRRSESENIIN